MNLNHVHLGTTNLEVFLDFYKVYFGFENKIDHGLGAFITNSDGFLIAVDPVNEIPAFPEWYHLGFCLDNEEKVINLYKRMNFNGVNIVRDLATRSGEFASFFIKDPDGYKIEISWHKE
jgi:catechol 2,3-dioxygenase-like lactoylglutathione lyase family enzyme